MVYVRYCLISIIYITCYAHCGPDFKMNSILSFMRNTGFTSNTFVLHAFNAWKHVTKSMHKYRYLFQEVLKHNDMNLEYTSVSIKQ